MTGEDKEYCALTTLREMVDMYSRKHDVSFSDAFLDIASSRTYREIFDFGTGVWREGPIYFIALYEEELAERKAASSSAGA